MKRKNFVEINKDVKIVMNEKKLERFRKQLEKDQFVWEIFD